MIRLPSSKALIPIPSLICQKHSFGRIFIINQFGYSIKRSNRVIIKFWIASSLSLSSGAHSRDPLARNDGFIIPPPPDLATLGHPPRAFRGGGIRSRLVISHAALEPSADEGGRKQDRKIDQRHDGI